MARILAFGWLMLAATLPAGPGVAGYGEPVRYAKGREIVFPDLRIRYLGTRHVSHPVFKPGFICCDFQVSGNAESKTISWSSGTGDIGPLCFSIGGMGFVLELKASVAGKGRLRDDELVLWTRAQFQDASEKRR